MVVAAVAQICSRNNVSNNLKICTSVIRRAAEGGAKLVCLPEASDYIAPAKEVYDLAEPLSSSTFVRGIQVAAKANSVWVSVGIHERPDPSSSTSGAAGKKGAAEDGTQQAPTAAKSNGQHRPDDSDSEDTRCYNTQCLISPDGEIADAYRKLHLFDVYLKDGLTVVESNTTIKGMDLPNVTQTSVGKVGMLTCYDLRFPEVGILCRQKGADIITYPAAFAQQTGMAHWQPLLRARAIETQSYILAAAQVGSHPPTQRVSYGSACIVDPWGTILGQCHGNVGAYEDNENEDSGSFCLADIDLDYIAKVRREMPLWDQRRTDVYRQL